MARPIPPTGEPLPTPETVPPLPIPHGFDSLPPADKAHTMEQLRTDASTDPYLLQGVAWNVLAGMFYARKLPEGQLFDETEHALSTIIDRKDELPSDDPALYFDTRLTLATLNAFKTWQEKRLLGAEPRAQIARNVGGIIQEVAEPVDFNLNELEPRIAQKTVEAIMIGMCATRQHWPIPTAVPAMPTLHRLQGIDPGTNTSAFSLYLLRKKQLNSSEELAIPMSVVRGRDNKMHDPSQRRGVLQLSMDSLLWNTSNNDALANIRETRRAQGGIEKARAWLLAGGARCLVTYQTTGRMSGDFPLLFTLATGYVGRCAADYDPNGLNALVKKL